MRMHHFALTALSIAAFVCQLRADTTWTGAADNLRWDSPLNWSNGPPSIVERGFINGVNTVLLDAAAGPTTIQRLILADSMASDDVTLNLVGASLTVGGATNIEVGTIGRATLNISAGSSVGIAQHLRLAVDNFATTQGAVIVDNSVLNVGNSIIMAPGNASSLLQTLDLIDATVTASRVFVADGPHSRAEVTMSGNSTFTVNDLAIPSNFGEPDLQGHFQLDGGVMQVNNPSVGGTANQPSGFRLANGFAINSSDPSAINIGTMDITGGTLRLVGDATTLIQSYVDGGFLTGYGGAGQILVDYDQSLAGFTTVTASLVPEPASWSAIAIGLVVCQGWARRRSRRL